MRLFLTLIIFILISHCSFDNKTGIWIEENNRSKSKKENDLFKEFETLSSVSDSLEKELPINKNYNFRLTKPIINTRWLDNFYNKENNLKNFKYKNLNKLTFKSKKVFKYKTSNLLLDSNNIITSDEKGNIYVSDTFTDTIYRLNTFGQLTKWLYSPELQAPNGLHYEKGQLIVGSWGHPTDGWSAAEVGHLKIISLKTKKIKSLGNGKAVGNLDGVESDGNNAYYVADWVGGKLLHIQKNGSFKEVLKLSQGVADHEVIHDKNMIIIPMMLEGKLITYKIN